MYDSTGELIATFYYDAWGNSQYIYDQNGSVIRDTSHIANMISIGYRGYVRDSERDTFNSNNIGSFLSILLM